MSQEDIVSNAIMKHLKSMDWSIIQYHSPGGQANISIEVKGDITFPDIIGLKAGSILVMENKSSYNEEDIAKLRRMKRDPGAMHQVRTVAQDWAVREGEKLLGDPEVHCGHGFSGRAETAPLPDIDLFWVLDDSEVVLIACKENPVVL